mmetsp:Transcript_5437/g.20484  ORF Transcript_5437/g.20484 Transcript_5437/m.20484 type:complete len:211 (+) Transcript_5437:1878-2510(+)
MPLYLLQHLLRYPPSPRPRASRRAQSRNPPSPRARRRPPPRHEARYSCSKNYSQQRASPRPWLPSPQTYNTPPLHTPLCTRLSSRHRYLRIATIYPRARPRRRPVSDRRTLSRSFPESPDWAPAARRRDRTPRPRVAVPRIREAIVADSWWLDSSRRSRSHYLGCYHSYHWSTFLGSPRPDGFVSGTPGFAPRTRNEHYGQFRVRQPAVN